MIYKRYIQKVNHKNETCGGGSGSIPDSCIRADNARQPICESMLRLCALTASWTPVLQLSGVLFFLRDNLHKLLYNARIDIGCMKVTFLWTLNFSVSVRKGNLIHQKKTGGQYEYVRNQSNV